MDPTPARRLRAGRRRRARRARGRARPRRAGATVTVVEARDRVGGRVWTIRDGFADGQHAEAGGDMIDEEPARDPRARRRARADAVRILRGGFGYVRRDSERASPAGREARSRGWDRLARELGGCHSRYRLAEQRWDSPIAAEIWRGARSRSGSTRSKADAELRATATGLRGFFLADPDELSLLALVDQFARATTRRRRRDVPHRRAATTGCRPRWRRALGDRVQLSTEVVAVSHRGRRCAPA